MMNPSRNALSKWQAAWPTLDMEVEYRNARLPNPKQTTTLLKRSPHRWRDILGKCEVVCKITPSDIVFVIGPNHFIIDVYAYEQ